MDKFKGITEILNKTIGSWNIKGFQIEARYWMAIMIVILIFFLVLVLARVRHEYVHWSINKPSLSMIFWGFILAIIFEGLLLVFGRTIFTEILGWEKAPKPISTIIDIGRNKLIKVMGSKDKYIIPTYKSVVEDFESLDSMQREKVTDYICK